MENDTTTPPVAPEQIITDLAEFAMDREETKFLLAHWPHGQGVRPVRLEYELQILKIIAVGWSLSYYIGQNPANTPLQNGFWQKIQQVAADVSATTNLIIGQDVDYFSVLKERLDHYVAAMARETRPIAPAQVVGPEFAELCGDRQDILTRMAGGKMFNNTMTRIRQYLEAARWM